MRSLITCSLLVLCSTAIPAEELFFQDAPKEHWAADAVRDLAKLGVTKGYPDGTFRGTNNISRYEIASFLAKFAQRSNGRGARERKLVAELRAEAAELRFAQDKQAREFKTSGELTVRARGSAVEPRGGALDYRLKLSLTRDLGYDSSLKLGLDTVDAGFNNETGRALTTKLLDLEGRFKLWELNWKVDLGPGTVVHAADLFPGERNTIFIRPKTAVEASTRINKLELSGAYVTRQVASSGLVGVHEWTGRLRYKFGALALEFRPRCLYQVGGPTDYLAEAGMNYMPNKYWLHHLLVAAGDFSAGNSGLYVKLEEKFFDPLKTGTNLVVRLDKIGSKYRHDLLNEYEFVYLNNFNRLILDGTVDLGLKIDQKLTDRLSAQWLSDWVTMGNLDYGAGFPGTYLLWRTSLFYQLTKEHKLAAWYQLYDVPSGTAQFNDPVPARSEVIGFSLTSGF